MSEIQVFQVGISNYKGFCIADISTYMTESNLAEVAIGWIPNEVRYDEYVAIANIVRSIHDDMSKLRQIQNMFEHPMKR